MIAGHPTTHELHSYRCFLPDLAGFGAARCAGPSDRGHKATSRIATQPLCLHSTPIPGIRPRTSRLETWPSG